MKTTAIIKQFLFAGILVMGMSIYTSCDSCGRQPDGSSEGTRDGMDANGDTRGSEKPADNENSGSTEGTGGGTVNDANTSSTSISASGTKSTMTQSTTGTGKTQGLSEEEITNQIENSNASTAYDKNGKPIINSGASGSGTGTGTGSTGNNSKVTTKEDQRN